MTGFSDHDLDERLASLPREALPKEDLWPVVRGSMEPRGATGPGRGWLRIAAAAALFVSGMFAGRYGLPGDADNPRLAPEGLAVAAAVQRAGTEYVAALANLRGAKARVTPNVVGQGRDAAMAALEGAAWELKQLSANDRTAAGIFTLAEADRQER